MKNTKMKCRIEEIPALSELTRDNYLRNGQLFAVFSTVFNATFMERYTEQLQKVKELIEPAVLTGEMKKITEHIAGHYDRARNMANKAEFHVKNAGSVLSVKPADFGFRNLRKSLAKRNDEAILRELRALVQLIDTNRAALVEHGLTEEFYNELKDFTGQFEKDSLDQIRKQHERCELVRDNSVEFSAMWGMIIEICTAGRAIARERKDKIMYADYTISHLMKKVRLMRSTTDKEPEDTTSASPGVQTDRSAA